MTEIGSELGNERGTSLALIVVLVSCVLVIGLSVGLLSAHASKSSLNNWQIIQARAAADSGIELAKEKLLTQPSWRTGGDIEGPLDSSITNAAIQTVTITPGAVVNNKDGSVTETVTVDVIGVCGNATKEESSSFGVTYFQQHFH